MTKMTGLGPFLRKKMREKNEVANTFSGAQNFQFPLLWGDKFCTLPHAFNALTS